MVVSSRCKRFVIMVLALTLGACANIPPGAELANTKVSTGIERLETDTQKILNAYRESLRLAVKADFERIHNAAEKAVRSKRGVPIGTPLNNEQIQEVSGIVLLTFEKANVLIDEKIYETSQTVQKNSATVKTANDDITKLLSSAGRVGVARTEIISTVKDLIPLPDVSGIIDQAISLTQ